MKKSIKTVGLILCIVMLLSFSAVFFGCKRYTDESYSSNVSCFGWEGDKNAPFIYMDGSFYIRERSLMVHFGVTDVPGRINWELTEGYLPCFKSIYTKNKLRHTISTFADKLVIDGNDFVVAYTCMKTENTSTKRRKLPAVSAELIPLGDYPDTIEGKSSCTRYYAIAVDRFGNDYGYPSAEKIVAAGDYYTHYANMKNYWNNRLDGICNLELPDKKLTNSYKAGYIFTMIVKDDDELHVGENGYDRVFDHDIIGMLVSLVQLGDISSFEEYASHILDNVQYPDARWKYSYPFAVYLQKTNDLSLIERHFENIKTNTHSIEEDRTSQGIMKSTNAIDAEGNWLIDNWSALAGLTTYAYLAEKLYSDNGNEDYLTEMQWANSLYANLKQSVEGVLTDTVDKNNLTYLPVSLTEPNDNNRCRAFNDANWAAHFLFGRWAWDGYLFGAEQDGIMLDMIDSTYDYGFGRLSEHDYPQYTFGGFPGVCSAYNAGYGSAALRGEKYRDAGIKAYQFMINNTQSAPMSWWECAVGYGTDGKWKNSFVANGWGSCPHMWGQSAATKVLLDSFVSERKDGSIIIGRGLPAEWLTQTNTISAKNFITGSGKIDVSITSDSQSITLVINGNHKALSLELLALKGYGGTATALDKNGNSVTAEYDSANGIVTASANAQTITISK